MRCLRQSATSALRAVVLVAVTSGAFAAPTASLTQQAPAPAIVLTAAQATYSIAAALTVGTRIEIRNLSSPRVRLERLAAHLDEQRAALAETYQHAEAVITLRHAWPADPLFAYARRAQVRMVEIDATAASDPKLAAVALLMRSGADVSGCAEYLPEIWLSLANAMKMTEIISADLERLFPDEAAKLRNNAQDVRARLYNLKSEFERKVAALDEARVVTLAPELAYLTNDLGIELVRSYDKSEDLWTAEDLAQFEADLKSADVKLVLGRREPGSAIATAIAHAGARIAVLRVMDPGIALDHEHLDPQAYWQVMSASLAGLYAALTANHRTPKDSQ